jgi:hypothetical protein
MIFFIPCLSRKDEDHWSIFSVTYTRSMCERGRFVKLEKKTVTKLLKIRPILWRQNQVQWFLMVSGIGEKTNKIMVISTNFLNLLMLPE